MSALARTLPGLAMHGAIAVGLIGCFGSSPPLFGKDQADYPIRSLTYDSGDGDVVLKRDGDTYRYINPANGGEVIEVLLYRVADNLYIVEAMDHGDAEYAIAKRSGKTIMLQANCDNIDDALLARLNTKRDKNKPACEMKTLNDLLELAQSPTIWSRGTQTIEIKSIE